MSGLEKIREFWAAHEDAAVVCGFSHAAFMDAVTAVWNAGYTAGQGTEGLRTALQRLRDHGYQPMYNGRPSCPFCLNFIDAEETHAAGCVLVSALAGSVS